jgi:predicted lactoylglutathione lyase
MPDSKQRMIFPNLAVKDLDRSVAFFTQLGFTFDERFTDETATAMVVSDQAVVMLLTRERFSEFTGKQLVDSGTHIETMIAVSAESRQEVDELADKALASGGSPASDPVEMGDFMYARSFNDPDGHHWEVVWMDMAAAEQAAQEQGAAA